MPERSRITPICQQSGLLNLKSAHSEQGPPRTNQASICLHFGPAPRSQITKKSCILLHFSLPFLPPFLFIASCQPYLSSSSVITTPALLLLSRPSWGAQYDCNGSALHGVCVMSHHNGSIVALSFFNPCAHRPHCYFQIL